MQAGEAAGVEPSDGQEGSMKDRGTKEEEGAHGSIKSRQGQPRELAHEVE